MNRNLCTSLSTTDSDNNTVHVSSWTCNGVDGAVQLYVEDGLGHFWASPTPTFSQIFAGGGPTKIEANDVIMKFFDKFSLDKESVVSSAVSTYTAASSVLLPFTQVTGPPTAAVPTTTARPGATTTTGTGAPTGTGSGAAERLGGSFGLLGGMNAFCAVVLAVL